MGFLVFELTRGRASSGDVFDNRPIWDCPDFAPGVIIGIRPRFRPRTAVANDIIPGQIVFIQLCLFAVTAGAWGANDHLVLAPVYPCPGRRRPYRRRYSGTRPRIVVDPPAVLFKYLDDAGTFSPIFAQHGRCWFCILVDDCLDFVRKLHCVCLYL